MAELLIHLEEPGQWQRHIARHVFQRMLGWDVAFSAGVEEARSSAAPVFCFGMEPLAGSYHMLPLADVEGPGGWDMQHDLPQNVLGMAHFILQQGLDHGVTAGRLDDHGRARAIDLFVSRKGLLDRPIVDQWVLALADRMRATMPDLPPVRRQYMQVATMDVDNGFKYLGRPAWRTVGSAVRDLVHGRLGELRDRASTLIGARKDPYDVYDDFRSLAEGNARRVIVNFLVAPRGEHDHAVGLSDARMRNRMREVATWAEVGIHPSYRSSDDTGLFKRERDALVNALGRPVNISRQHFLRMRYPATLQELDDAGIREEHSLGPHDAIGFTAGTCTPFPYFDVENDRETQLMIHPFQVMDSALAYRMKLSPEDAIAAAKRIVDRVKAVHGTFIGVWHERFLSDHGTEKGWGRVVEEVIKHARP